MYMVAMPTWWTHKYCTSSKPDAYVYALSKSQIVSYIYIYKLQGETQLEKTVSKADIGASDLTSIPLG